MTTTIPPVATMLDIHRAVWDMPRLAENYPEIIDWLETRFEVVFPEMFTGAVYVITKGSPDQSLRDMGTTDVREAVATLLTEATS